jgi:hypothetical protein
MTSKDSLGHAIANVIRRTIPEHTLSNVPDSDKVLLQNIIHLVQDSIPEVNVTLMEIEKGNQIYNVRIPISVRTFILGLEQLRQIQAYSPARISDVCVGLNAETPHVTIRVTTETRALIFSEVDIIRITKRMRT